MAHTLVGVFRDQNEAQSAVDALMDAGFTRGSIHMSSQGGSSMSRMDYDADHDASSESGIGHFFRSLFGMDDDDQYTTRYSSAAERGNCIVSVDVDNDAQTQQAMEVLNRCNPVDIDEDDTTLTGTTDATDATDAMSATGTRTGVETTGRMNAEGGTLEGGARIPVIEEDLQIGKREVQRGGVRIFQRVSEKPVDETVQLREEHVNVERRPVNQPASEADFNAFKEGSMELRETAEEAVVAKQARVVEEVVVNKEVSERTEHVHDTVRRTDVEVQNLGTGINAGGTTGTTGTTRTTTGTDPTGLRGTGGYDPDAGDVARSDDMLANEPQTDWGGRTDGRPGALDGTPAMATARMTAATNPDASVGASGYPNDESEFRNHWQRAYGNVGSSEGAYEDYAPAYRYGYSMAGNQQYRGQRWEDVEPDLRRDWDSNHPGSESTWDRMKDAIRHGWDRMTD